LSRKEAVEEHRSYLLWLVLLIVVPAGVIFAVNWMVDPLWFSRGNRLGEQNFIYNERVSKLNRFMDDLDQYDCVILGDSRASLLDADALRGANCFNLAFAGGNLRDLSSYAAYLQAHTPRLKRAVIGLGMFNFVDQTLLDNAPDFVVRMEPPPGPEASYFSPSVLRFSLQSLVGRSPTPIYYDRRFRARILRDEDSFDINPALRAEAWNFYMATGPFSLERVSQLRQALGFLAGAELLAYVPPVSAQHIRDVDRAGHLESYLDTLYGVSQLFDVFQDYSIPSNVTLDPSLTIDGQHYFEEVNARIADALNRGVTDFGIDVKQLDRASLEAIYRDAFTKMELRAHPQARPGSGYEASAETPGEPTRRDVELDESGPVNPRSGSGARSESGGPGARS